MNLFTEISLIIILVIVISIIIRLLKQPLIVGYILAGILAGPLFMKVITINDAFTAFSQVGVALLLFIVGLGLNPKLIREVGPVAAIAGFGQVLITGALGFGLMHWILNFSTTLSLYLTLALTFSSTIVVVKLLSDKNTLETLYGRMAIGILLIQDLVAVVALMYISSLSGVSNLSFSNYTFALLAKGLISMLLLMLFGYYILPKLGSFVARSQEFLLIFSIGWCLALAALFHYLGFSIEIGALLAGVTLSMTPYNHEVSSKVKPLRDFFLVLFFIILGSQMEFSNLQSLTVPIIIITLFILILKPLIIMGLIGLLGYTKRNSFITGLSLAQVSEFSFILITLGTNVGQIDKSAISFITIVGLISLATSSYFILYSEKIYNLLAPVLGFLERKGRKIDEYKLQREKGYDVVLFGQNRVGYDILESVKKQQKSFLVIDFNPNTIKELTKNKIDCRYGDAGDIELLNQINFKKVKMVISTIPDPDTNLLLITRAKQINHNLIVIVIAHQIDDALKFYERGASYVLMPHFVGGNYMASLLENYEFDVKKFLNEKVKHQAYLKKRKLMGHEHPRAEHLR
ncbi:MAG: cation:proton antiporter [Candidatus Woesearchaeota archaeon]